MRGKAQIKSAFIMGQESTASQMLLYAKTLALLNKEFDFNDRIKLIDDLKLDDVLEVIEQLFDQRTMATSYVGAKRTPLKI